MNKNKLINVLIVGFGSVGQRHARILDSLGCQVAVVSAQIVKRYRCFKSMDNAIQKTIPDYVVIANQTSQHIESLRQLSAMGFKGTVLVEKPLFHKEIQMPKNIFKDLGIAYNLRFHPAILRLKRLMVREKIITINAYVGQYLPNWRPGTDYTKSYSSHRKKGGGALRDLSHDLDYLNWIFGPFDELVSLGGSFSSLDITSDDAYAIMMKSDLCPMLSIQLNYLDRVGRREVLINTDRNTFLLNLIDGSLMINGVKENYAVPRDHTYSEMHKEMLKGRLDIICSLSEAENILKLITASERSSKEGEWVKI